MWKFENVEINKCQLIIGKNRTLILLIGLILTEKILRMEFKCFYNKR